MASHVGVSKGIVYGVELRGGARDRRRDDLGAAVRAADAPLHACQGLQLQLLHGLTTTAVVASSQLSAQAACMVLSSMARCPPWPRGPPCQSRRRRSAQATYLFEAWHGPGSHQAGLVLSTMPACQAVSPRHNGSGCGAGLYALPHCQAVQLDGVGIFAFREHQQRASALQMQL